MKRFTIATATALALIVPTLAAANEPLKVVYRPELRQVIPVLPGVVVAKDFVAARSLKEEIARHEAMAIAYRGTRAAQAAAHCDRLLAELRDAHKGR